MNHVVQVSLDDLGHILMVARVAALSNLDNVTRYERDRRVFDLLQRAGL